MVYYWIFTFEVINTLTAFFRRIDSKTEKESLLIIQIPVYQHLNKFNACIEKLDPCLGIK